jgi:hypothetical protein
VAFMVLVLFVIGTIAVVVLGLAASGGSALKGRRRSYPAPVDRGHAGQAAGPSPEPPE